MARMPLPQEPGWIIWRRRKDIEGHPWRPIDRRAVWSSKAQADQAISDHEADDPDDEWEYKSWNSVIEKPPEEE